MKKARKVLLYISIIILFIMLVFICKYLYKAYNIGFDCVVNRFTGLYCAGCGMTRAVYSLIQLDFYQAFRYNVLSIVLLPIIVLYVLFEIYAKVFDKTNIMNRIPSWIWYTIAIVVVVFGIIRNIEYFSWLKPTVV